MTAALSAELIKALKIEEVMNVLSKPVCVCVRAPERERAYEGKGSVS